MGKKQNKKMKKQGGNRLAGIRKPTTKTVSTNLKKLKFQHQEQREALDGCLQQVVQAALKEKEEKAKAMETPPPQPLQQKLPVPDVDVAADEMARL